MQETDVIERSPSLSMRAAGGTTAAAVAVAVAIWMLAGIAGLDLIVSTGDSERKVTVIEVVAGSGISAVCGALLLHGMLGRLARARRWWTMVAMVCLIGSLANPLQASAWQAWAILTVMHLTTGAIVILGLRRGTRAGSA